MLRAATLSLRPCVFLLLASYAAGEAVSSPTVSYTHLTLPTIRLV